MKDKILCVLRSNLKDIKLQYDDFMVLDKNGVHILVSSEDKYASKIVKKPLFKIFDYTVCTRSIVNDILYKLYYVRYKGRKYKITESEFFDIFNPVKDSSILESKNELEKLCK